MNRNRFKKKSSINLGKLDISVKSTSANEENVPELPEAETSTASDPPTSSFRQPHPSPKVNKFSSKRAPAKEINGALDNITKRKAKRFNSNSDDMGKPFFERILGRCGFNFQPDGDTPHTLDQEQIFFIQSMQEQLEDDMNNSNIDDFMQRFISLHENDMRLFKKSLSSTKHTEGFESSTELDSLVHLLLEVAPLQSPLMTFLFDKLIEHVVEEGSHLEGLDEVGWSRLILGQMCGLSHLVDSKAFTSKLLEMLEIANPPVQQVFLMLLPRIIYDDQQEEVARCLSKLLKQGEELTPRLLDALSNLMTSRDIRENVMETVTGMLKQGRRKFLPQVISFLLTEAQFADDLPQIVQAMRRDVDLTPYGVTSTQQEEQASTMVKVVATLRANLNAIGEAGEVWLSAVFAAPSVTMLDVAVLVLLYDQGDAARRKNILSLVRTKSSSGALKEQVLNHTFTHHGKTLGQNFQSLTEIASHLLQCSDRTASHQGAIWYKLMYLHIDGYQRQQVLYNVIMHVGLCGTLTTQSALWVLLELVKKHLDLVLPQAALLMSPDGLLERVENVALEHARQIMDVLCCLAYSGHPSAEALRGDISMLIKKQLACPRPQTKRKGIVGAVMATKHITLIENDDSLDSLLDSNRKSNRASDALSESSDSTLSLPAGHKAIQAQVLIELVRASTKNNPDAYGFFYDEFASMAQGESLDFKFMAWLTDMMVNLFQDDYVIDEEFNKQLPREVPLSHQYGIDGDQNPIIAALGMQVVRHEMISCGRTESTRVGSAVVSPYVMCALFRLVRILKFYTERGNLEDIDALLGCPLQLPRALQGLTRGGLISITDPFEQRCLLNSLFLAVNWLREVVNAFALLNDAEMSDKVMQRVRHIVLLEGKLRELMPAFPPDYTPPSCQFYAEVLPATKHTQGGKTGKASKKKKRARRKKSLQSSLHPALDNSDHECSDVEEESDKSDEEVEREGGLAPLSAYLRELDMTVFIMLSRDFVVKPTPPSGEEVTPELGPAELVFLLEDYCGKLEHCLVAGTANAASRKGRPVGMSAGSEGEKLGTTMAASSPLHFHLGVIETQKVVKNAARVTRHLCNKLEQVIAFFQELEQQNDGVRDGPGSDTELARQLGRCFLLLLRCLHATVAWSGLYTNQHSPLLLVILHDLADRVEGDTSKELQPKLVSTACRYLSQFGEFVLQLPTAVALVSLIQVVSSHDADAKSKEAPKNRQEIRNLCKMFLSRTWPTVPGGAVKMGPFVGQLMQMYIDNSEVRLVKVLSLLHKIQGAGEELKGKNAPGFMEQLPTITKLTLPAVYQVLATGVATGARAAAADPEHLTQSQGGNKVGRKLQAWSLVVEALQELMTIAKTHETRPLLNALFKNSQPVVRLFMEHGMRCLDKSLRRHPAEVQALLKRLQGVTRFLQNICCQAKMSGSAGLVQSIPNMKFLLEKLVQRVKGMLVLNGCTEAFWMGNLKNRNLRGEEIQTQDDEDEEAEENSEDERETQRQRKKKKKTSQAVTQRSEPTQARPSRAGPSQQAGPSGVKPSQRSGPSQAGTSKGGPSQRPGTSAAKTQQKRKSTETEKSKPSQKKKKSV